MIDFISERSELYKIITPHLKIKNFFINFKNTYDLKK